MAAPSETGRLKQAEPKPQYEIVGSRKIAFVNYPLSTGEIMSEDVEKVVDYSSTEKRLSWKLMALNNIHNQGSMGSSHGHSLFSCIEYMHRMAMQQEKKSSFTVPKPNRKQRRAALSNSKRKNRRGK